MKPLQARLEQVTNLQKALRLAANQLQNTEVPFNIKPVQMLSQHKASAIPVSWEH